MAEEIKIIMENRHLFVEIKDQVWLINNKSPITFGEQTRRFKVKDGKNLPDGIELRIDDQAFTVASYYRDENSDSISKKFNKKVYGVIGNNILNSFDIIFDIQNKNAIFSRDHLDLKGNKIEVLAATPTDAPIIQIKLFKQSEPISAVFHTGSPVCYLSDKFSLRDYEFIEKYEDFYPPNLKFDVDLHLVPVTIGDREFQLKFGSIPHQIRNLLSEDKTLAFIGTEIFEKCSKIGYFLKRKEIVLC
jgi:hypothetical protein